MKRIFFIVVWFFVFFLLFFICGLVCAILLDAAGFESARNLIFNKLFVPFFFITLVLGLALGLYGFLPGTRETNLGANKLRFEDKGLKYLVLRFGLYAILLLVTSPIGAAIFWLANFKAFDWISFPLALLYLFGIGWFTKKTAEHMAFEGFGIFKAMKWACVDLRLRLAFLPVIGGWFVSDTGKRGDAEENDE